MKNLSASDLARFIDHTLLKPEATRHQIQQLCAEAREHGFWSVCVNGSWVPIARKELGGSPVKVAAVVGFPLGATSSAVKIYEVGVATDEGAEEIDLVLNVGRLKDSEDAFVQDEISAVVAVANGAKVKVILETCLLTQEEKEHACRLVVRAGAHFVKTSTGFSRGGATLEDVRLMRSMVGADFGVKASGGIRDTQAALAMIEAGANRLGTSAGIAIVTGLPKGTGTD